jgi:hypothetical protein
VASTPSCRAPARPSLREAGTVKRGASKERDLHNQA